MRRKRKDDNLLELVLKEIKTSDFDSIEIIYNNKSLKDTENIDLSDIDISTKFLDIEMREPFFINSITGENDMESLIKHNLHQVAKKTGIAIVTSFKDLEMENYIAPTKKNLLNNELYSSFLLNFKYMPNLLIRYNSKNKLDCSTSYDILGLQIDIDTLNEVIIPERTGNYSVSLEYINNIMKLKKFSIIIKESGKSIKKKSLERLLSAGVGSIEISGYSGNNLDYLNKFKLNNREYYFLENYGQSTIIDLLESRDYIDEMDIIVSSGIRKPKDIIKSFCLGAKAVGITEYIINNILNYGLEYTVESVKSLREIIKNQMLLLSSNKVDDLKKVNLRISGRPKEYSIYNRIDHEKYMTRNF